jgi:predicted SprT family Zn-dependent metalloprotease
MTNCHEMKKGEVYVCSECGLELQVVKECKDSGTGC